MRWLLDEFLEELKQDPDRRVLFVEGVSDLRFWRDVIPEVDRDRIAIYPIAYIQIEAPGGERGRLVAMSMVAEVEALSDRLHFFADADFDRLLGRPVRENLTLTDGRDMESYLLLGDGLHKICATCNDVARVSDELRNFLRQAARPIAVMRVTSEMQCWQLPFRATLEKVNRYIDRRTKILDEHALLRALVQNSALGLAQLQLVVGEVRNEAPRVNGFPDHEVIHGKDMCALLSWYMGWGQEETKVIVALSLSAVVPQVRLMPNLARVDQWINRAA